MPIVQDLIKRISSDNIAEDYTSTDGGQLLRNVARRVIENYERDLESMSEWLGDIEEGQEIAEQDTSTKSEPWQGASNYKSSTMISAAVSFGDRSSTELLRTKLVKTQVIGKDNDGRKKASSENVAEFMNWQIDHQMTDWRCNQETLLYALPNFGTMFKKIFFCPIEGVNKSELVHYPNFVVNQGVSSMRECRVFSCLLAIPKNEAMENVAAGVWLDVDLYPDAAEGIEGSNSEQNVNDAADNPEMFIEQYCTYDLDDDGYEEPYIITVHRGSCKVVRIVANYDIGDIYIKRNGVTSSVKRIMSSDSQDISGKLVRISPQQSIVKYDFIKPCDGTFLGLGYYRLLSSLSKAINSTTNLLMDAGVLANLPGGWLANGFREKMGNHSFKPGEFKSTNIPAADLHNGILPHQFDEPSQVLFALNESLKAELKQFSVELDLKGTLAPNAPATTTLALIQEAMVPTSAIMQRIIAAESAEFRLMYILNSKYTDPDLYQKVLDDAEASFEFDFDLESMSISPTACAEMSSRMQRIQQAEAMILQAPNIALTGGDVRAIWESWFDAIGADWMVNQVWPDPKQMSEEQAARQEAQQVAQQKQDRLLMVKVDHEERKVASTEADINSKIQERKVRALEVYAKLKEIEASTLLKLEQAESEQVKNQIDIYTARLAGVSRAVEFAQAEIENETRERDDAREAEERLRASGLPNQQGAIPGMETQPGNPTNVSGI